MPCLYGPGLDASCQGHGLKLHLGRDMQARVGVSGLRSGFQKEKDHPSRAEMVNVDRGIQVLRGGEGFPKPRLQGGRMKTSLFYA